MKAADLTWRYNEVMQRATAFVVDASGLEHFIHKNDDGSFNYSSCDWFIEPFITTRSVLMLACWLQDKEPKPCA